MWHVTAGWTQAGNTPFSWYKQSAYRGGQTDPLVISWPKGIDKNHAGQIRPQYHHIIDIAPTILEAAGVEAPEVIDGVEQMPFDGMPMNYSFNEPEAEDRRTMQYYELFGNRAIYADGWTAVTQHKARRPWQLNREGSVETDVWELFKVDEDFSQSTNLADQYPEKLEELKALWDQQAKANNVYPLDGDLAPRLANMQKLFSPKKDTFVYYPPAAIRVHESVSPAVKNKSHEFIADVNIPSGSAEGMLVTSGGRTGGYGFFVKDRRLVYVYNYLGVERTVLTSTEELPTGKAQLGFKFTKTGNFEGDAELFINGKSVGKTHVANTIPATFSIEETFDVGEDTGSPIIEDVYAPPFRFEALEKMTVKLGND